MAPSVWDLSNMRKEEEESFKENAQCWRALAAKITNQISRETFNLPFDQHLG